MNGGCLPSFALRPLQFGTRATLKSFRIEPDMSRHE
jgi:hypothetical protein